MTNNRLGWKVLFVSLLIVNMWATYTSTTLPDSLLPVHPAWLSLSLAPLELLILLAAFCAAFSKKYITNVSIWWFVLVSHFLINTLVYYYEFQAGGYTSTEMVDFIFVSVVLYFLFISPVFKYISDIQRCNSRSDIQHYL